MNLNGERELKVTREKLRLLKDHYRSRLEETTERTLAQ